MLYSYIRFYYVRNKCISKNFIKSITMYKLEINYNVEKPKMHRVFFWLGQYHLIIIKKIYFNNLSKHLSPEQRRYNFICYFFVLFLIQKDTNIVVLHLLKIHPPRNNFGCLFPLDARLCKYPNMMGWLR